ncbi:hypothetical protein PT015_00735 [Candidatus Mycobacterium wuenschmannii]|uniref:Uncharacterized protein n=1 Tax=Candidatus Mycobacterium wuenschmannii TaxID=3027808 RepID=A0ABY8VYB5_9MYCO|nr:hypothetical protein [Candidatus Mycobacterium wuenschmannii]WIM88091.1 hypothetical protein PT015_00735 [Candidatus Mycobacterium wuenschmannii]
MILAIWDMRPLSADGVVSNCCPPTGVATGGERRDLGDDVGLFECDCVFCRGGDILAGNDAACGVGDTRWQSPNVSTARAGIARTGVRRCLIDGVKTQ